MTRAAPLVILCVAVVASGCAPASRLVRACPAETLGGAALGAAVGYAETPGVRTPERTAWVVLTALSIAGSAALPCRAALAQRDAVERRLARDSTRLHDARARTLAALDRDLARAEADVRAGRRRCRVGRLGALPGLEDLAQCVRDARAHDPRVGDLRAAVAHVEASPQMVTPEVVRLAEPADVFAVRLVLPLDALFEAEGTHLRPEAEPVLAAVAAALARSGPELVAVRAHTSPSGDAESDHAWTDHYAIAVSDRLVLRGRPAFPEPYGAAVPVGDPATPEGRAASRRVEILALTRF